MRPTPDRKPQSELLAGAPVDQRIALFDAFLARLKATGVKVPSKPASLDNMAETVYGILFESWSNRTPMDPQKCNCVNHTAIAKGRYGQCQNPVKIFSSIGGGPNTPMCAVHLSMTGAGCPAPVDPYVRNLEPSSVQEYTRESKSNLGAGYQMGISTWKTLIEQQAKTPENVQRAKEHKAPVWNPPSEQVAESTLRAIELKKRAMDTLKELQKEFPALSLADAKERARATLEARYIDDAEAKQILGQASTFNDEVNEGRRLAAEQTSDSAIALVQKNLGEYVVAHALDHPEYAQLVQTYNFLIATTFKPTARSMYTGLRRVVFIPSPHSEDELKTVVADDAVPKCLIVQTDVKGTINSIAEHNYKATRQTGGLMQVLQDAGMAGASNAVLEILEDHFKARLLTYHLKKEVDEGRLIAGKYKMYNPIKPGCMIHKALLTDAELESVGLRRAEIMAGLSLDNGVRMAQEDLDAFLPSTAGKAAAPAAVKGGKKANVVSGRELQEQIAKASAASASVEFPSAPVVKHERFSNAEPIEFA